SLLLPAIERRQFVLGSQAGKPLFYMSWAKFDLQAEARYLQRHSALMPAADWDSGNRLWIVDWVAPFGHTQTLARIVRRRLFRQWMGRMFYHREDQRGVKIMRFRGSAVLPDDAQIWFEANPLAHPGDTRPVAL
ncbi:MAG: toxin-activating lysine-acyltransferase, partial [Lacisediminimonas sp.]|nr:toxin-activating lysine-acyltransferase [Lacisediminimonas sp.]